MPTLRVVRVSLFNFTQRGEGRPDLTFPPDQDHAVSAELAAELRTHPGSAHYLKHGLIALYDDKPSTPLVEPKGKKVAGPVQEVELGHFGKEKPT